MGLSDEALAEARATIARALDEDLRYGPDVTTMATVPADTTTKAAMVTREPGVAAGVDLALLVLDEVLGADGYRVTGRVEDGARLDAGDALLTVEADARGLLTAERTMLNLVSHLSGIATETARWVAAVEGTHAKIRDTRKTLPGLRALQKYAVRVGGGVNHRMGLGDAALIKDNHVAAAGGVVEALRAVRAAAPDLPCEVEVDSLEELDEVLAEGHRTRSAGQLSGVADPDRRAAPRCQGTGNAAGVLGRPVARNGRRIRGHRCRLPCGRRAHPLGTRPGHRPGRLGRRCADICLPRAPRISSCRRAKRPPSVIPLIRPIGPEGVEWWPSSP